MSAYVIEKHDNKCAACGKPSKGKFQIHHTDYNHACIYEDKNPDCGNCRQQSPKAFQDCASRLVPVHGRCHLQIHKDELDEKALRSLNTKPRKTSRSNNRQKMKKAIQETFDKVYQKGMQQEEFLSYLLNNGYTLKRKTKTTFTLYNQHGHRAQIKWADLINKQQSFDKL